MDEQQVERVTDASGLETALEIRRRVFIEGQGVPEDRELDGRDDEATHLIARDGDTAVGTARLRAYAGAGDNAPTTAKVERVAVLEPRRGEGWGACLMDAVETEARGQGYERILLHAQVPVVGFYERLGYEVRGEEFEDAGIPHCEMTKGL